MRIALLSDVHGNLPAFEAVLDDVDSEGAEEIWCLGDLVGYGAEPDDCVALARERCDLSLAGNHDLVVTGEIDDHRLLADAAAAARWTRENIAESRSAYLEGPGAGRRAREPGLYHASPRDPVWEYVLSTWQADECMDAMDAAGGGRRALARGALLPPGGRRERVRGAGAGRHRSAICRAATGSSTRAGWASRATATRGRRGSC